MEPTSFAALHAEVESRFLGAGPRPWPTPRTGHDGPADEEYSRRLHPEKYVITQQRATAWAVALVCFGAATVNSLGPENWRPGGAVVTTSITATRSGTEPVFLHFSSDYLPGVIVAYGSA